MKNVSLKNTFTWKSIAPLWWYNPIQSMLQINICFDTHMWNFEKYTSKQENIGLYFIGSVWLVRRRVWIGQNCEYSRNGSKEAKSSMDISWWRIFCKRRWRCCGKLWANVANKVANIYKYYYHAFVISYIIPEA